MEGRPSAFLGPPSACDLGYLPPPGLLPDDRGLVWTRLREVGDRAPRLREGARLRFPVGDATSTEAFSRASGITWGSAREIWTLGRVCRKPVRGVRGCSSRVRGRSAAGSGCRDTTSKVWVRPSPAGRVPSGRGLGLAEDLRDAGVQGIVGDRKGNTGIPHSGRDCNNAPPLVLPAVTGDTQAPRTAQCCLCSSAESIHTPPRERHVL